MHLVELREYLKECQPPDFPDATNIFIKVGRDLYRIGDFAKVYVSTATWETHYPDGSPPPIFLATEDKPFMRAELPDPFDES